MKIAVRERNSREESKGAFRKSRERNSREESRVAFENSSEREIAGRRVGLHLKIAVRERKSREESRVAFENSSEREKKQGGE